MKELPARRADRPDPGFYKVRLVKGGPHVAARITWAPATDPVTGEMLDRSWFWTVTINEEPVANPSTCPWLAGAERVFLGERIDEAEYQFLLKVRSWAVRSAPDAPEANPRERIDLTKMRPLF